MKINTDPERKMTEQENRTAAEALIGITVRSFDFEWHRNIEGENACYVIGTVTGILKRGEFASDGETSFPDCDRYIITADSKTFRGEHDRLQVENQQFFPPLNGTPSFDGTTNMVERVA